MEHLRRSGAKNPERSAEKLVDQEFETFEDLLNFSSSRLYDMLMKECSLKAKSADLVVFSLSNRQPLVDTWVLGFCAWRSLSLLGCNCLLLG